MAIIAIPTSDGQFELEGFSDIVWDNVSPIVEKPVFGNPYFNPNTGRNSTLVGQTEYENITAEALLDAEIKRRFDAFRVTWKNRNAGITATRITCILRQAIPDDLTSIDSWQKDPKITPKEVDERTLAKLITKWGDRESLTSLEVAQMPIESRGVLLEVFKSFCMPTAELVEDTDEEGATENILSAQ